MSKPVMYLIASKEPRLSPGKLAAQVSHAAVRAYIDSEQEIAAEWLDNGETKIVLEARDTAHLLSAREYIKSRGLLTSLVIDEGRTEIDPHTPTVIGVVIVDKDDPDVKFTFESFKTYREKKPDPPKLNGLALLRKR